MSDLTINKVMKVIILYLQGYSYDEIAKKTGVSKGSVFNIISDLKKGLLPEISTIPEEIEQLRELAITLKRSGISPIHAKIGISVLERVTAMGIEPKDIERCHTLLQALSLPDKDLPAMAKSILTIEEIKQKTGLTLEKLEAKVVSLRQEVEQLAPISKEVETRKKELTKLEKERESLIEKTNDLSDRRDSLSDSVDRLEVKESKLLNNVTKLEERAHSADKKLSDARWDLKTLDKMGMSIEELNRFTIKLKELVAHHDMKREDLSNRLFKELMLLDKILSLEYSIKEREAQLDRTGNEIAKGQVEKEGLHSYLAQLTSEKTELEAQLARYRKELAQDIATLSSASKETIHRINDGLESGIEVSLSQVHRLADEAANVGKQIGKMEASIESLSWIKPLLLLVRGENGLDNYQVRIIGLNVLRSMSSWLNEKHGSDLYWLKSNINNAIGELEKWNPSVT